MANDFLGVEVKIRSFVVLPEMHGIGLRFGVVYRVEGDDVSIYTEDARVSHRSSMDCVWVPDRLVPKDTRRALLGGIMGVFHPKETE